MASQGLLPAGLRCSALGADGTQIPFEIGDGLISGTGPYPVNAAWNAHGSGGVDGWNLAPYWWDDSQQCLPADSTTLWLLGIGHQLTAGIRLLIDTLDPTGAAAPVREFVTVATATESEDPVFSVQVTELTLATPTTLAHDLGQTHLAGNIVPAVHGLRATETFVIPTYPPHQAPPPAAGPPAAVGPDRRELDPRQLDPAIPLYALRASDLVAAAAAVGRRHERKRPPSSRRSCSAGRAPTALRAPPAGAPARRVGSGRRGCSTRRPRTRCSHSRPSDMRLSAAPVGDVVRLRRRGRHDPIRRRVIWAGPRTRDGVHGRVSGRRRQRRQRAGGHDHQYRRRRAGRVELARRVRP